MHLWVDADACPNVIKDILFRASERLKLPLTLVANQPLRVPRSPLIRALVVPGGFDEADDEIARRVSPGDIVITADIPLAAAVLDRGGHALSPRGERYTQDTIRERLRIRDMMEQLRDSGVRTGGPAPLSQADRQTFANALERLLPRA
ncbi:MAG: YaiI/YqxD family protein [Pseudomonadota bacterium]